MAVPMDTASQDCENSRGRGIIVSLRLDSYFMGKLNIVHQIDKLQLIIQHACTFSTHFLFLFFYWK